MTIEAESAASFTEWVHEALANGAGKAHKWTVKNTGPLPVQQFLIDDDGILHDQPIQAMKAREKKWMKFWQRDASEYQKLEEALETARLRAVKQQQEHPRAPITVQDIDVALASWTGQIGVDLESIEVRSPSFIREWLSPSEQALVGQDPLKQNLAWSAKEAVFKAMGKGMALNPRNLHLEAVGPDQLEVSLHGDVAQHHQNSGAGKIAVRWRVFDGKLWVDAQITP